ncbi:MAG: family efflux transporter [Rhodospirillales bacterium]|nr:family efflux transporter [Rhodospirillales bacterium]
MSSVIASTNSASARVDTSKPMWKPFLVFLMPMMATNVLQLLSGTINSIVLGGMLGVHALSVVSGFFPILFLLISFVIGLGSGASVLIGQAYGANELVRVKAAAGTTLTVSIVIGLIIAIFGGPFVQDMLQLLGTPPDVMADETEYARVFLYSVPLLFVFIIYTTITRGVGDSRTPFLALLVQNVVGTLLMVGLIRGWGGLPKLGVISGAYATIISFFITVVWLAGYLLWKRHPLAPDRVLLRQLKIDWKLFFLLIKIGVPTGIQVTLIALSEMAVMKFVNAYGSGAIAAYGAVLQVWSYVQLPAVSIGIAASVFGAQAIGRGDSAGLGRITRTGIELQFVITGLLVILVYLFSRTILGWSIKDSAVADVAESLVQITLWSFLIYGLVAVLTGVMRSSGSVFWPTLLSIIAIWAIQVPVSWALSRKMGLDGIWIAYPIAYIAMFAMQGAYYRLVWQKKTHARLI